MLVVFIVNQIGPSRRDVLISGRETADNGVINPHHTDLGTLAKDQGRRERDPGVSDLGYCWLQLRRPLTVRVKGSGPRFQRCKNPLAIPHVIVDGA